MDKIKRYSSREIFIIFLIFGFTLSISSATTLVLYWIIEEFINFKITISFNSFDFSSMGLMLLLFFVVNLFISSFYLLIVSRLIVRPIYNVMEASERVAKGDYSVVVKRHRSFKFINNAIDNFNTMTKHLNSVEMLQTDFVSNVSHEIKTPLSAIEGYAQLLKGNPNLSEIEIGFIDKIINNSKHLTNLVENILVITKFENQQIADNKNWYRLDEQIRKAVLFMEEKSRTKNICFNLNLDKIEINANQSVLYHVWHNIISNAVKFSDNNSSIDISAKVVDGNAVVKIRDYGIGMTPETITHIFEKFYQADTSHHSGGNGLGLPLVKRIVDIYNGQINVTSQPDKGTCFTVILKIDE